MKFYSEKLDKLFDTPEALAEAEAEAKKAADEKAKKAEAKRVEAKAVEDAFKAYNITKKSYNEFVIARRKKYAEDLAALRAAFDADVGAAAKELDGAAKVYDEALKKFTDKHKNFHLTLKDGDNVVTLQSNSNLNNSDLIKTTFNDDWFETFFNLFKI